ncbi:unnamed protein product, partial [marine sediment metagenome]
QFYAGGCKHEDFIKIFDAEKLTEGFSALDYPSIIIFGEAYGGKCQKMSKTYGPNLKFIAFEVKIGDSWLCVPNADDVTKQLGLEFVHYKLVPIDLDIFDKERDAFSIQAERNGMGKDKLREGIVLRPVVELRQNNGNRIIAKHKGEAFRETRTKRKVGNPNKLKILSGANKIAEEWVTHMRLSHVLDSFGEEPQIEQTGDIIRAMIEDIERESEGEIVISREAKTAIGRRTAKIFKEKLQEKIKR